MLWALLTPLSAPQPASRSSCPPSPTTATSGRPPPARGRRARRSAASPEPRPAGGGMARSSRDGSQHPLPESVPSTGMARLRRGERGDPPLPGDSFCPGAARAPARGWARAAPALPADTGPVLGWEWGDWAGCWWGQPCPRGGPWGNPNFAVNKSPCQQQRWAVNHLVPWQLWPCSASQEGPALRGESCSRRVMRHRAAPWAPSLPQQPACSGCCSPFPPGKRHGQTTREAATLY